MVDSIPGGVNLDTMIMEMNMVDPCSIADGMLPPAIYKTNAGIPSDL